MQKLKALVVLFQCLVDVDSEVTRLDCSKSSTNRTNLMHLVRFINIKTKQSLEKA